MINKYTDINKDQLYDLYINQNYTQKQCAEALDTKDWIIRKALKEYDIPRREYTGDRSSQLIINMTDEMYEILRGALLGDGSLMIPKRGINAKFSYMSKSFQHVEYVSNYFAEYSQCGIKRSDRYDKRTDKTYVSYNFRTNASKTLTDEYYKWYYDGKKHIPDDLILTPLMCKVWYIGDGCLTRVSNNDTSQKLYLCTNCFAKEEIENILLPQLEKFHPYLSKTENDGQYRITIGHKKYIKKFIEYIGECPFDDYKYKWDVSEATKGYNGETSKCDDTKEWIFLYKAGLSYSKIGALYQCTRGAVEHQLYTIYHMTKKDRDPELNYLTWKDEYAKTEEIDKIPEQYKKNAIKRYIGYIYTHSKWPKAKDHIIEILNTN